MDIFLDFCLLYKNQQAVWQGTLILRSSGWLRLYFRRYLNMPNLIKKRVWSLECDLLKALTLFRRRPVDK